MLSPVIVVINTKISIFIIGSQTHVLNKQMRLVQFSNGYQLLFSSFKTNPTNGYMNLVYLLVSVSESLENLKRTSTG